MSALRELAVGDRVAHREDACWADGDGVVVAVRSGITWVEWGARRDLGGPYHREELVAMDDPDMPDGAVSL